MAQITKKIELAKTFLDAEELVAIPTETVYGLAAKGISTKALKKIFEAKGRPINNPLILHFKDVKSIAPFVDGLTEEIHTMAEHFWPGPLTLLLPKSPQVPEIVTAGLERVAVRIPNHSKTLELLALLDYPLAAPSANPSGYISPTRPKHVERLLGNKIPLILDGGPCDSGIESTILGWEGNTPVIYRQGGIPMEDIEKVLGRKPRIHQKSEVLHTPGMSLSHYAPNTKTIVTKDILEHLQHYHDRDQKVGLISFQKHPTAQKSIAKEIVLSKDGNLEEMARKIYDAMHQLDSLGLDVLIIETAPEKGIGNAINDRLYRSASINKDN